MIPLLRFWSNSIRSSKSRRSSHSSHVDAELQKEACKKLEDTLGQITAEKGRAIASRDEETANILLGCEFVATAMLAEIKCRCCSNRNSPIGVGSASHGSRTVANAIQGA